MSVVALAEARARVATLPADDPVAQDIIDEQEAWLARRIGALSGERTETFYVGVGETRGKLGLARFTDAVVVTDGGSAVDADLIRLVDGGSAIVRAYAAGSRWWSGPYVTAVYTPSDETEVRSAIFDLLALALASPGGVGYQSEAIGAYSYTRGSGTSSPVAARAIIVSRLLPKHDPNVTVITRRPLLTSDNAVINRPEPVE